MPSPDTRLGGPAPQASFPEQTRDAVLEALAHTASTLEKTETGHISRRAFLKGLAFFAATASPLWAVACNVVGAQPVPPAAETGAATPVPTIKPAKPTLSPQEQAKEAYSSLVFSSLDRLMKKAPDSQKEALRAHLNAATVKAFLVLDQKQGGLRPEVYQFGDSLVNFASISYQDGGLGFLATNMSSDGKTVEGATLIDLKRTLGKVPLLGVDFLTDQPAMVLSETKNGKGETIVLPALVNTNQQFQALTEVNGESAAGFEVGGKIVWEEAKQVASLNILSMDNTPTPFPSPTRPPPPLSQGKENIYYPVIKTVDNAPVYSGPGNLGYENPATLAKDTQVKITGNYVDFYKVSYTDKDGKPQEGYVYGKTLDAKALAFNQDFTAQLAPEAVLWQTVKNIGIKGYDNSGKTDWFTYMKSLAYSVTAAPFQAEIQLTGRGKDYSASIYGRAFTGEWWQGVRRLDISGLQYPNLVFYDGTSTTPYLFKLKKRPYDGKYNVRFLDVKGKKIMVMDSAGNPLTSDGQPVTLPTELFPDGKVYFGLNVGPNSQLEISQFNISTPPSGKYGEAVAEGGFSSEFPALPQGMNPEYYNAAFGGGINSVVSRLVTEEGNTRAYSIWGKLKAISLDASNRVQLTLITNTWAEETRIFTIVPSAKNNIQFATNQIKEAKIENGRMRGGKWTYYPSYEEPFYNMSDPAEVVEAFNFYIEFLKSKGVIDYLVSLQSKNQNFSPDENGVYRILFYYPSFSQ